MNKAKALNESLKAKRLPPELRIKILLESLGITKLTQLCQQDPDLLDVCTIYRRTICKETLNAWKIGVSSDTDHCDFVKRILRIIMSEINSGSRYGDEFGSESNVGDEENDMYNVVWQLFLDTSDLKRRNEYLFELGAKWNDTFVLETLMSSLNKVELAKELQERVIDIIARYDNQVVLTFLINKGLLDNEVLLFGVNKAIRFESLNVLGLLLSSGVGDANRALEIAIRSDSPRSFFYLISVGGKIEDFSNVESPKIYKQLIRMITGRQ